jgi:hypothetical protein
MPKPRQARLLVILSIVLSAHLAAIWLLLSSRQLSIKTKSGSFQLVWIPPPALSETAPGRGVTPEKPSKSIPHRRVERTPDLPGSIAPPSTAEDNAIHPAPDWNEELRLAAKNALANQLAQKRHELDFAHTFPTQPKTPPQFAWDYAATHRVEALPQGGMVIHLSDNCVLLLFPLPLVGCGIGKRPTNGNLFEHLHD